MACPLWGDGSLWGDGDLYCSTEGQAVEYLADQEVHCHRLSIKFNYTADLVPGSPEAFRIFSIRPRLAQDSQESFTYEAFIDASTPSERIAAVIKHSGSEFIVSHIQLIATQKKHQPKG